MQRHPAMPIGWMVAVYRLNLLFECLIFEG
jgi:hypothetical protein